MKTRSKTNPRIAVPAAPASIASAKLPVNW
jgi:hypothetical protein